MYPRLESLARDAREEQAGSDLFMNQILPFAKISWGAYVGPGMERSISFLPQPRGPHFRPQLVMLLILGTPKKVPFILGNPKPSTLYIPI